MLLPELKLRRDKIRSLMAQQEIDAALIACNVNLIYTYGRVVSGYLYLPLNAPARLFIKRPNNIEGEHIHPIRKPEQLPDLLKECGLPIPARLMLEGDELSFTEYNRLAACFPETEVLPCGTALIRKARSVKTEIEIEMFRRSGIAHAKAYEQIPSVYRPGMTDCQLSIEIERLCAWKVVWAFSVPSDKVWRFLWEVCWQETMPLRLPPMILLWEAKDLTRHCLSV